MLMEVFVHVVHLNDFKKGKPVNCKINYASQYDMRLLLDPKKFVILPSSGSNNLVTIRKKKLLDYLGLKKHKSK